ncbi:MAG: hypothetical protein ACTSQP_22435 [Promethearchaeota archaeon]
MKEKILSIRIERELYDKITKKASLLKLRVSSYIRDLIKQDLNLIESNSKSNKNNQKGLNPNSNMREFSDFKKKYALIKEENEELTKKMEFLKNQIEKLRNIKLTLLKEIKFLMDFFQLNKSLLIKNNKEFILKNQERFKQIVKYLEEYNKNEL